MKGLKKIVNLAIANDWMHKNPFAGIRFQEKEVIREVLTKEEIERMMCKEFALPRLEYVRDVFIFCVFTGMAYVDVNNLRQEHIVRDNNDDLWIRKARQKTNNMCNIPLLKIPQLLMEKYKNHPLCTKTGALLPVPSNQKMNSYLKEIADFCGIQKNLTTHAARHTFATTITLSQGVAIETISKLLGHKNIRTTQIYANITHSHISGEMERLSKRINSLCPDWTPSGMPNESERLY